MPRHISFERVALYFMIFLTEQRCRLLRRFSSDAGFEMLRH